MTSCSSVFGKRASSAFWEACKNVTLTKIAERPGAFAVFVNGAPTPQTGGCGATPTQDQGLAIEFGRMRSAADGRCLQKHVAAAGFVQAKVEQLGCSLYRVVETGVPNAAVGQSIVAEAKSAGHHGEARRAASGSPPPHPTSRGRRDART